MPLFCDGELCLRNIPGVLPDGGGGFYIKLINKTGVASIKGTVVCHGASADLGFDVAAAGSYDPVGVVLDDGVPDGGYCRVIVKGMAQILLVNSVGITRGDWIRLSATVDGRIDSSASPPGASVTHWAECGHGAETVTGGTNKLAWCDVHFN